jgi:formyl-CoA transferase
MSELPLAGVRVLDLSNLLAAPMATMYLADFGADVVKVEHPVRGDELRNWGLARDRVGLFYKMVNRNKRLVTLDLASERGRELCLRLAREVDVVVENFRPGTLRRWGLGPDELRAANPRLVVARVTGYGQTGPYAHRPGFGTLAEAFSGYAAMSGFADRPPLLPAFGLGDATTAIHVAFGIMLALYHRDARGGEGQEVDAGLYEGLFTLLGSHVVDHDQLGVVPQRLGSRLPFVAPRNTYRTADGAWVAIAGATQATFERIARTLGIEHVLDDPDLADNRARVENVEKLDAEIQAAVERFPLAELLRLFDDAAAPVGPAYDVSQIFEDPHYAARGNVASVPDEELGELRMQSPVPRLTRTPGRIAHAAPPKGAHNREIYCGLLGLSEDELAELAAARVI